MTIETRALLALAIVLGLPVLFVQLVVEVVTR